jgi:hypothetical protein
VAVEGTGEHLAAAKELLDGLASITDQRSGDAQTRATVAVAHAVLALAEQVAMLRHAASPGDG